MLGSGDTNLARNGRAIVDFGDDNSGNVFILFTTAQWGKPGIKLLFHRAASAKNPMYGS